MPDAVLDELSQRTRQVEARIERKLDRFRATFDRDPTPREAWRLEREAVLDSRPAKKHPGERVDLRAEWSERIEGLGFDPEGVVDAAAGGLPAPGRLTPEVQVAMVDQALAALAGSQSTWRPNELLMEVARAVPTTVHAPPEELVEALERLRDDVPDERCVDLTPAFDGPRRDSDGRPTSESILDRRDTSRFILDEEFAIVDWADERWSARGTPAHLPDVGSLDPAQAHAASLVAGTHPLVVVVGPAGTGKTTMLRAAVESLAAEGRRTFGLAPSAAAAEVLAEETSIAADTVDKAALRRRPRSYNQGARVWPMASASTPALVRSRRYARGVQSGQSLPKRRWSRGTSLSASDAESHCSGLPCRNTAERSKYRFVR